MKTSERGIALIKKSEGFAAHTYNDIGAPAIGYGHRLLPNEVYAAGISMADADALLRKDLATRFEPILNVRLPADCTQSQYDALVDFVYNVKNQPKSLEQLLSHGWDQVPVQLLRWCHAENEKTGVMEENTGLKARRQAEADMFVSQI
jgi:lysozyme